MQLMTEALVPDRQAALRADGERVRVGRLARLRSRRRRAADTTTQQTWSANGHRPAKLRPATAPASAGCN